VVVCIHVCVDQSILRYKSIVLSIKMKLFIFLFMIVLVSASNTCTCPEVCEDKEELGRGTWKLLHDIVKAKPPDCGKHLAILLETLSHIYPCEECRTHIKQFISFYSPKLPECTEKWMCEFHNVVNQRLSKPLHDCQMINNPGFSPLNNN
jgi:hypothetical protein